MREVPSQDVIEWNKSLGADFPLDHLYKPSFILTVRTGTRFSRGRPM